MAQKDETFLMVSLEESKAKKLAQVISNDTSRIILDALSRKDATETELSEDLQMPISTVHYNLKQLTEAGLVVSKEFHYSEKGKEVNHYSLANKFIIIAPQSREGVTVKIRRVLPAALFAAAVSGIGFILGGRNQQFGAEQMVRSSADALPMMAAKAAPVAAGAAAMQIPSVNIAGWFLFGALFSIASFVVWEYVRERIGR